MPTITIDDQPIQVPDGTTVLQACQMAQQRVPYYCYHPGLSIAGNCRICLVEIEGAPKLQISCNTRATDGMKVRTTTDKVKQAQREVLEFLLINHPLDCPVCDQAGECELQNYYLEFGAYDPKFNEAKVKKSVKATPISNHIMLDMERCILCSRCVRFCDEVSKTGELAIFNRGDHAEVGIYPGKTLDQNNYGGNVIDICPVGALTERDFRFECRVWYLGSIESVCPGCSNGCNINVHYNKEREWRPQIADGKRIMRLKPRYHADINQWWMCDVGRYGYPFVDEERLATPVMKVDGVTKPVDWKAVPLQLAHKLQAAGDAVGVIASTHLTNEDLFLVRMLFQETLKLSRVTAQLPAAAAADDGFLLKADRTPNTAGAKVIGLLNGLTGETILQQAHMGQIKLLWVFGHDLFTRFDERWVREALARVDTVIFQGSNHHRFVEAAHIVLPSATFVEKDGTFTNHQGRVQRLRQVVPPLGQSRLDWDILQYVGAQMGLGTTYATSEAVFEDLSVALPSFAGMSYAKIGRRGLVMNSEAAEAVTR